jgi:sugar phosphate permease
MRILRLPLNMWNICVSLFETIYISYQVRRFINVRKKQNKLTNRDAKILTRFDITCTYISYRVIKGFDDKDNSLLFLAVHLITIVICEVKVPCTSTLFLIFIMSNTNTADQSNIHLKDLVSNTM